MHGCGLQFGQEKKKRQRGLRLTIVVQSNTEMVIAKEQAEVLIFTRSADRGNWAGGKCRRALARMWRCGQGNARLRCGWVKKRFLLPACKTKGTELWKCYKTEQRDAQGKGKRARNLRAKGCPKGPWHQLLLNKHTHSESFQETEFTNTFASISAWLALAAVVALKRLTIMQEDFAVLISQH